MVHDLKIIGNRIYEARKSKGLKQHELSDKLGIKQSSYSRLENGEYDIPITKLITLCEILDISISWLIREDIIPQLTVRERHELEEYKKYLLSRRK